MLKKTMLLASMALAVAAITIPAMASAEGALTHEGVPVPTNEPITLSLSGFLEFDIPDIASGYGCEFESEAELVYAHPGTATFELVNTENCVGSGLLAECELIAHEVNDPYQVAVTSTKFIVTKAGGTIVKNNVFDENCLVPAGEFTFEKIKATPNNTSSISTFTIHGYGTEDVTELPITLTGDMSVEPAGTYGIE